MPEVTDTRRPFSVIPEGKHRVTILEAPLKKRSKAGNIIYQFKFGYIVDGERKTWTAFFMAWDLGVILAALRFTHISEHSYEWDREECRGRILDVLIVHQPDTKDPAKIWPKITEANEANGPTDSEEIGF